MFATITLSIIFLPAAIGRAITLLFRRLKLCYVPIIVSLLYIPLTLGNYKAKIFFLEDVFEKAGIPSNKYLLCGSFILYIIIGIMYPYILAKWGATFTNKVISINRKKLDELEAGGKKSSEQKC